jgi:hypothetical protein
MLCRAAFVVNLREKVTDIMERVAESLVQTPLTNAASMTRALFIFRPRNVLAPSNLNVHHHFLISVCISSKISMQNAIKCDMSSERQIMLPGAARARSLASVVVLTAAPERP